jgi:hypothetical protein
VTFREDLAAAVAAGTKTVTRRPVSSNPRSPYFVGRDPSSWPAEVAVQPGRGKPAIARARLVSAQLLRLERLHPAEAVREGFESPADFEDQWSAFHGEYDPASLVWRIELQVIRDA